MQSIAQQLTSTRQKIQAWQNIANTSENAAAREAAQRAIARLQRRVDDILDILECEASE